MMTLLWVQICRSETAKNFWSYRDKTELRLWSLCVHRNEVGMTSITKNSDHWSTISWILGYGRHSELIPMNVISSFSTRLGRYLQNFEIYLSWNKALLLFNHMYADHVFWHRLRTFEFFLDNTIHRWIGPLTL